MKSLVTGAKGQLGKRLLRHLGDQAYGITRQDWDLEKPDSGREVFFAEKWDAVYHCAAYTAVDRAESELEKLRKITVDSTRALGKWCADTATPLVFYSTDYVFSGIDNEPLVETKSKSPLNAYGKAKNEAEEILLDLAKNQSLKLILLRTQWVYDHEGKNFFTAILRKLTQEKNARVVKDQIGQTTWAKDLAEASNKLVRGKVYDHQDFKPFPVLHFRQSGEAISWFDFADAIREEAQKRGLLPQEAVVHPITTAEYPLAAQRPEHSFLSIEKIRQLGIQPLEWRNALSKCMDEI